MKRTLIAAYLALFITCVPAFCLVWRSSGGAGPEPSPAAAPAVLSLRESAVPSLSLIHI